MWDLSCLDWEERLRSGRSLVREDLPLFRAEADLAVQFFNELRLPDVPGNPKMERPPATGSARSLPRSSARATRRATPG